jgi:hypothetical protein
LDLGYCGVPEGGGVEGLGFGVLGVSVDGEFGVPEPGLTLPAPEALPLPLVCGAVVEPAAPLVVSLGAGELGSAELGAGDVAAALAVPPVGAPDHQSCEARCLGEAFR